MIIGNKSAGSKSADNKSNNSWSIVCKSLDGMDADNMYVIGKDISNGATCSEYTIMGC